MYTYYMNILVPFGSWKPGWQTNSGLEFNKYLKDPQNLPASLHRGDAGDSCISSGSNVTFDVWVERYNLPVFCDLKALHHIAPYGTPPSLVRRAASFSQFQTPLSTVFYWPKFCFSKKYWNPQCLGCWKIPIPCECCMFFLILSNGTETDESFRLK
jgi:hypothetical protein